MTTLTSWLRALRTRLSRAAARWPRCSASRARARSVVAPCHRTASRPTRARPTAVSRLKSAKRFSPLSGAPVAPVMFTLMLAWALAGLCVALQTPWPWMIGPSLITAVFSMLGGPLASWTPLRNAGQWTFGCALGLYFTPQVGGLVAGLWWAVALKIVWARCCSSACRWSRRFM